jgi:hypothetical protein
MERINQPEVEMELVEVRRGKPELEHMFSQLKNLD